MVLVDGEVPERSNGAVSKTVVPYGHPGFESLSLRQLYDTNARLVNLGIHEIGNRLKSNSFDRNHLL